MARRRSLSSMLFRVARDMDTGEALASGDPARIERRALNIAKGRLLARAGIWKLLWGGVRRR